MTTEPQYNQEEKDHNTIKEKRPENHNIIKKNDHRTTIQ